jgi:hypothetical protein
MILRLALTSSIALSILSQPIPAHAGERRSGWTRAAFQRLYPCPETGERRGACPGWVVDHIEPICAGGADIIENMQWQRRAESIDKDRLERAVCAAMRGR